MIPLHIQYMHRLSNEKTQLGKLAILLEAATDEQLSEAYFFQVCEVSA